METTDLVVLTVAVTFVSVVGIALNMNILLVYIGNLRNGLTLGPSERVHLTKALVNCSMHVSVVAQFIIYAFWPHLLSTNDLFVWSSLINMILNYYSYWLTAVLCVYYCTNITNCGHHIFVWLKRSLSTYLLHILLASGLGSVAISLPVFWFRSVNPAKNNTYQSIITQATNIPNVTFRTTATTLGCFLPFTIAFVSTTITSWSLISHIWRMKQNNRGFTTSNLQPQINATRTMVLFLLFSVVYNVSQMFFFPFLPSGSDVLVIVCGFVMESYPISEAIIIIQSSSKIRSVLLGKFCDRKRGNSEAET